MGSGLRRLVRVVVGLTAVVAGSVTPAVVAPDVAAAAPGDFYQAPSPLPPGQPGAIIRTPAGDGPGDRADRECHDGDVSLPRCPGP